jgi:hypothetical protein
MEKNDASEIPRLRDKRFPKGGLFKATLVQASLDRSLSTLPTTSVQVFRTAKKIAEWSLKMHRPTRKAKHDDYPAFPLFVMLTV